MSHVVWSDPSNRDEALHRNRINYEVRNHVNHDDDNEIAEDEIDGRPE